MRESLIAQRSLAFSLDTIKLTKSLSKSYENVIVIKQIIRSSTSIGANIQEALGSNSKKEFIHSMNIAKKEARETYYWLRILKEINPSINMQKLAQENEELVAMLTSIVKTSTLKLSTNNS